MEEDEAPLRTLEDPIGLGNDSALDSVIGHSFVETLNEETAEPEYEDLHFSKDGMHWWSKIVTFVSLEWEYVNQNIS